ncbi:MAG: 2-oxo acid dehydrogenase subunit E2 [Acetobacterium sp.]|nr:2-oxo acid dehydrogenase subunit E2 [Bacillota bacterium]MCG2730346.1 2-oxo acid dehydrogenase subunit E2 [Acetobacterium sp.]
MMENEIILPKEKLDMTAENLTNTATVGLTGVNKEDAVLHDDKQEESLQAAVSDQKTEITEGIRTEAQVEEINAPAEDVLGEDLAEENLEEKLTAAIEALERNLEETIKEGTKDQRSEAVREIIKDEDIEETLEEALEEELKEELLAVQEEAPQEFPESDPREGKVRATPSARRIAREFKVDIKKATGTGPNGRIEVDDVKKMVVIQPGTFNFKSKEPVVISTNLEKLAGNPQNLFSLPVKLEEPPAKKADTRKKLKDMNQKIEKLPNPDLDFVPFVDENAEKFEAKDADVVTKISELDFVPFVDIKAEPLREEIIVKPTPMHQLHEAEQEEIELPNRKPRGLRRKTTVQDKNESDIAAKKINAIEVDEPKVCELEAVEQEVCELEVNEPEADAPETLAVETTELKTAEPESLEPEVESLQIEVHEIKIPEIEVREIENNEIEMAPLEPELSKEKLADHSAATDEPAPVEEKLIKSNLETAVITLTTEIDMTEIKDLRKKITKKIEDQVKCRCTYTDFLLLATSRALIKHPLINARREGDQIIMHTYVHMGLTVESDQALIVPVIENTQDLDFVEMVKSRGDLLKTVKNRQLPPERFQGSTFTITNLGMYGIREFTAIINQPNSAILSVGEVVQRIRVHQGEPVVRSVMKISLNLDRQVADGVEGAKFLQDIKADMENPSLLLF